MFRQSVGVFFMGDVFGSIFRFPFWWYSSGFLQLINSIIRTLAYRWRQYNLGLWISHFFTPMYGAYDLGSRLMSIVVRFGVIFGRGIAFLVEAFAWGLIVLLWFFTIPIFLWLLISSSSMSYAFDFLSLFI